MEDLTTFSDDRIITRLDLIEYLSEHSDDVEADLGAYIYAATFPRGYQPGVHPEDTVADLQTEAERRGLLSRT